LNDSGKPVKESVKETSGGEKPVIDEKPKQLMAAGETATGTRTQKPAEQVAASADVSPPGSGERSRSTITYHALIVGVSHYKFEGAGLVSLERPVIDASQLSETLLKHYAFEAKNVHLLKDATRGDIIDELEALGSRLTEKDNLIIFYA